MWDGYTAVGWVGVACDRVTPFQTGPVAATEERPTSEGLGFTRPNAERPRA